MRRKERYEKKRARGRDERTASTRLSKLGATCSLFNELMKNRTATKREEGGHVESKKGSA
jgi:hypothetical protein